MRVLSVFAMSAALLAMPVAAFAATDGDSETVGAVKITGNQMNQLNESDMNMSNTDMDNMSENSTNTQ